MTKRLEQAASRMSHRAFVGSICKTVLYWLAVGGVWVGYSYFSGRPLTHPSMIIFTVFLVIPFLWPGIHKLWSQRSFRGTVVQIKDLVVLKSGAGRGAKKIVLHLQIAVRTPEGVEKMVFTEGDEYQIAQNYYHMGEEVWKLKCLKYPINLTDLEERTEDVVCPRCGRFTNVQKKKCHWCRLPLLTSGRTT